MTNASVLISDIAGSTQLYETASNREALTQISKVLGRLREIIETTGGKCVKSQGDDVLSFFEHPEAAFQTALAMIHEPWPEGLSVHVGTYFGEILPHENDIYGSAVNTAARLTSLAKPGEILAGDQSYDALSPDSQARFQMIGEIQLRGKTQPTRVYSCSAAEMSEQTVVFARSSKARSGGAEYAELSLGEQIWQIGEGESVTIGRSTSSDIVVSQPWVSRKHAALSVRRGQLEFTDHSASGSVIRMADGSEVLLHRRTTLLNGAGTIYPGPHNQLDTSGGIGFRIHELALMEVRNQNP